LRKEALLLLLLLFNIAAYADSYDEKNYPPAVSVDLEQTNLPIVFIDTRCGGDTTKIIHKDWRVSARMKVIHNEPDMNYGDTLAHPNQTVDYEGWIAIRYRGYSSFIGSPKKPFSIKTMESDDPNGNNQKVKILGMPKDHKWVLIAPYSDRSMIRDVLMFQLARPYFDYTPRCSLCEVVVDGIYYGVYVLAESIRKGKHRLNLDDPGTIGDELTGGYQLQIDRNDEDYYYTSKHLAVDSLGKTYRAYNKIYMQYKHPEYEEMLPVQLEYIQHRIDVMEDVLASYYFANPAYGYRQYLDPQSFIDYQLSQEFCGNIDGYRLSTNIYKHRDSQDPRFKTTIWDFNLAFGNSSLCSATRTDFWRYQNSYFTNYNCANKVPFWWMRLMEDPNYVVQLKERWAQYRHEAYDDSHIEAVIDSLVNLLQIGDALQRNFTAWPLWDKNIAPNYKTVNTYDKEIAQMKSWIADRLQWMDEQLEYGANSSVVAPSASFKGSVTGYFNLQGMRLDEPPRQGLFLVRFSDGTSRIYRQQSR
jgi:hypothetical protein